MPVISLPVTDAKRLAVIADKFTSDDATMVIRGVEITVLDDKRARALASDRYVLGALLMEASTADASSWLGPDETPAPAGTRVVLDGPQLAAALKAAVKAVARTVTPILITIGDGDRVSVGDAFRTVSARVDVVDGDFPKFDKLIPADLGKPLAEPMAVDPKKLAPFQALAAVEGRTVLRMSFTPRPTAPVMINIDSHFMGLLMPTRIPDGVTTAVPDWFAETPAAPAESESAASTVEAAAV